MEHFDVEVSIANLINEFNETSMKDNTSILEWFYKSLNYKSIFRSRFLDTIIKSLKDKGIREIKDSNEELETFKRLMKNESELDIFELSDALLSLILRSLVEHQTITPYLEQLILVYNETYNNENIYKEMMSKLKSAIGENVVFVLIKNGNVNLFSGKLESVDSYNSVVIDGREYPFIGHNIEINKISCDGIILYSNVISSPKDDLKDNNVIEEKKNKLFGSNYHDTFRLI